MTIAANIQRFSPHLIGAGRLRTRADTEPYDLPVLELNLGRLSAPVDGLLTQAQVLVDRLASPLYQAYRSRWKMINIFVGGINACHICEVDESNNATHYSTPENVERSMNQLIQFLHDNIPRDELGRQYVFINVFTLFTRISPLYHFGKNSFWCQRVHDYGAFCNCLYESDANRQRMNEILPVYNERLLALVGRWQQRTQNAQDLLETRFRVSAVRVMETMDLEDLGKPFISAADCFHPNECYHRLVSFRAWNTMTEGKNRVDEKGWYKDRSALHWGSCEVYQAATLNEML